MPGIKHYKLAAYQDVQEYLELVSKMARCMNVTMSKPKELLRYNVKNILEEQGSRKAHETSKVYFIDHEAEANN